MPRSRFVKPESLTLPLSEGDFLVVKRRLSMGEIREAQTLELMLAPQKDPNDPTEVPKWITNPKTMGWGRIAAHLVDWSFEFPIRGLPLDRVLATLQSLEDDDANEVRRAVEAHAQRQWELREAEKKTRSGEAPLSPISVSPDAADGATSGSEISTPMSTPSFVRS